MMRARCSTLPIPQLSTYGCSISSLASCNRAPSNAFATKSAWYLQVHVSASYKRIAAIFAIQHALALTRRIRARALALTRRIRARVLQLEHPNLLHTREHFQLLLLPLQVPEASWSQQLLHPLKEQGACPQQLTSERKNGQMLGIKQPSDYVCFIYRCIFLS